MSALDTALGPVARLLNKNILESTPARDLCRQLSGSTIAVRVRDTALATYFLIDDEAIEVVGASDKEPDVVIDGSIITLARMAGQSGESAIRDGSLGLSGNAETAKQFQQLLSHARPDIEEELSAFVGDIAAHKLGTMARGVRRWSLDARATMGSNIREYLQEESRDVPSRYEVERFTGHVSALRDDVERLAARINRLREAD